MSVLENIRKGTDSTSTRVLIGVVVAVFIFWGAGNGSNDRTSIYASVNGQAISDSDFRREYAQVARRVGRNLSEDEEKQLQSSVLTELINQEALIQEAKRLGITVSADEVTREIVKGESFKGKDGKFDDRTYERLLRANNTSPAQYEDAMQRRLVVQKLVELAGQSVTITDAELRASFLKDQTTLDLGFVRLPTAAFVGDIEVTPADRDAFVSQNGDRIKARYDESKSRFYDLPKRYQLRTILLKTDLPGTEESVVAERAAAVRAEAAAGADFEYLAKRWSEDLSASNGGQLGLLAVDQLDPAIAAAADAAGTGQVTDVVKTSRGLQIVRVDKIEDAKVIPLEEAQADIAESMLREERAPQAAEAFAARVIEAWKTSGSAPADLLAEHHLAADTTGEFSLGDPEVPRLGDSPELRQQIATAAAGYVVPIPLKLKDTLFVVAVDSRTDADPATFEATRTMIEGRLRAERHAAFVEEWRANVVASAKVERNQAF